MNMNEINQLDLRLKLLAGESLYVDNIEIKPLLLKEIVSIGFTLYQQYLSILLAKVDDFIDTKIHDIPEGTTIFELIITSKQEELINLLINGLSVFLREKDIYFNEAGIVYGDISNGVENCKVINNDNFNNIVRIIKHQNYIIDNQNESNPANDKAKSILDKLKKAKEFINKKDRSEDIDFSDIVSAVSTKANSINKFNIWNLTLYQLYDEYKRLDYISNYETNILSIMNGAKNIDLKHWSGKLNS